VLFAVDIGNTNIVIAIHDGNDWVENWRIHSDAKKTTDEYYVLLESLSKHGKAKKYNIDRAVISSVVPNLTRAIEKNIKRLFDISPIMINQECITGLIPSSIPQQIGNDLLCNLAQAHNLHPLKNVMVVDFGTALTMSCVNNNGEVLGVSIAPGLITAVNSLFGNTAQLPQVELKKPKHVMGRTTDQSIRSGIMNGYAGLVESMILRTEAEYGIELHVIATGGLSNTICKEINRIDEVDMFHTLNGMKLIASLN